MILCSLRDIVFGYENEPVIRNVSVDIHAGEFIAVAGPNGAAKTTLLKLLLGLVKPWSGTIRFSSEYGRSAIAYVPQQISSFNPGFPSKVIELVRSGCYPELGLFRRFRKEHHELVEKTLKEVGLWELRNRKIGDLSGGQKQRACIARAMVQQPDLLVLDEPVTGMDPASRLRFYKWMQQVVKTQGKTVLMVTHGLDEAEEYLDRVIYLEGREEGDHVPV
ncbi:metal ABC transporter ATP-binding protein [Paenibacillus azoreducens]|uniref:High-affinity zinc uptake system ATP-binding protein ZnuC n=1 Tax=Paenibacillus azoreducens TaxID=116718 RepID=A0A919Y9L7_9BACL|nr:metal ABC transporter ATP-binding protein [Paenibacillus azoreducens]GIO45713.1 high-affinity zinc uptake system ATP-binding protein ZnuC [Paenibacillus azoreducens]